VRSIYPKRLQRFNDEMVTAGPMRIGHALRAREFCFQPLERVLPQGEVSPLRNGASNAAVSPGTLEREVRDPLKRVVVRWKYSIPVLNQFC
jgi:hypothetical protein